jgi:hypothetical protein
MMRAMRRLFAVTLGVLLAGFAPHFACADDSQYVAGIEDLPLMPGLKQSPVPSLDFKHLFAHAVNTNAKGDVSPQQVTDYYAETLPEHGWVQVTPVQYRRGNEDLDIAVRSSHMSGAMVHFELLPNKG